MTLFYELRKHGKLAAKRNPMYDKNRFGKYAMYAMAAFWAGYLIFFGTTFAFAFDTNSMEPYHIMNSGLIFILALDFILRFPLQKTPTQEVKPYLLLPVKRNTVIDFLLIRSGLSSYNFFWLFLFVPFAIITLPKFFGIWGVITYCTGIWLLMVFNNYWFLLCRTLIGERLWWICLPVLVYGGIAAGLLIPDKSPIGDFFINLGEGYIKGNLLAFVGTLVAIIILWFINRKMMAGLVYDELNKVEDTKVNASEYKFFEKYGEVGEYMRLELKMLLRNKVCKNSLRMVIIVVVAFSLILGFTDIYDGTGMKNFITVYNFAIFGILFLLQIMSYEGNYIDGLMSRKESIYSLLRAKYMLYSIGILLPLILSIPAMVMGKIEVLTAFSWAIFTIGFIYFCLFQMAVYNTKTVPLNVKLAGRQNTGTGLQNLISFATFGIPLLLYAVLKMTIGETATAWMLLAIGLVFILTSRFWLKNVYDRFMKRRYKNMEGFRDSRQQ
ncbi:hypothetical protein H8744_01345 [Oscillospiraceae bacterium N12]|jgi:hypothetical protein|uniref:Transmembrane protein n=1 Tax=Jilunia laotingensis TaxID=2763675 RepID=A0A926F0Q5_9BACT|nr:DUF5687 family protein [Jilunia laotingensis]MBC8591905.1 hypothetical protein [Jilunia laotingensis]